MAGTETVLVMDHEPTKRVAPAYILRQRGYRVFEAFGGLEAQQLAATCGKVQLLLMDLNSAESRDLELALWFRAMYREIKVLVISDSFQDLNHGLAKSHQITFLAKPFTPLELAHIVRRILS